MRVAVIQPSIPNYRYEFFKTLTENSSYTVHLFVSDESLGQINSSKPLPITSKLSTKSFGVFYYLKGLSLEQVVDYDLIVTFSNARYVSNLGLYIYTRWKNKRFVGWGHLVGKSPFFGNLLRRLYLNIFDGLLFYMEFEAHQFQRLRPDAITGYLNNGMPLAAGFDDGFKRLFNRSNKHNLLLVGRLTQKSNVRLVVEALELLAKLNISYRLDIVGIEQDEYENFYDSKVKTSGIFFHGAIDDFDLIKNISKRCSFFVYGGDIGLSLIHAFALGLPVIIHDDFEKHMPEARAFEPEINGFLFRRGSVDSLVSLLMKNFTTVRSLESISTRNLRAFREKYNCKVMAENFLDFCSKFND